MRAVCGKCGAAQPPDWKAGDLCGSCGAAVRRDVRCFWCAKWTPFAKFCRSCGAETVEETLYGAARMLKDAGTDRFTVPKLLRELPADQVENFTRIYQRHAAVVARHVEELRFLERFLFHKDFSAALEEILVPQLPWAEETLKRMTGSPIPPGDDLAAAKAVGETTPFPATKAVASLVRLLLGDGNAYKEATHAFNASDPALRSEAALALTGWRIQAAFGRPRDERGAIVEELERSPFKLEAAVRLALLGRPNEGLLREALGSPDPETAFAAALALGDVDRLQAALQGDELQKIAAGNKLIELGVIKPVEQVIERSPLEVQRELVESVMRRKGPAPELGETLLQIVEKTEDETLRERAARVLCRELRPEWAMRIARAAGQDRHIFQSLLSEGAALPPEAVSELARHMIGTGLFGMHQYGLKEAGTRGAIPDGFVPAEFGRADEKVRKELLSLAEAQLEARGDEALHRFVMGVLFDPHPAPIRAAAWWVLHRWYRHLGEHRGEGPFRIAREPIERFFGSIGSFLPKLAAVLRDEATLKEVGVYEFLAHLFSTAEASAMPDLFAEEAAAHDLARAVLEALRGDYWAYLMDGMVQFMGLLGAHPRWRDESIEGIEALGRKGNYHWEKALRTLRLSAHGLPDEPEWPGLPDDFVPARFGSADAEGRRQLLQVAEQQLIHRQPEPVARFLLGVAFGPYDASTRIEAMRLCDERAPRELRRFPLKPGPVAAAFGSMGAFLPRLASVLGDREVLGEEAFLDFLRELLREADAPAVAAEEAASGLVRSLLDLVGRREVPRNLRSGAMGLLENLAGDVRWKDDVGTRLKELLESGECDLASECERLIRRLVPARPDPPPRRSSVPTVAPPPSENPWVAKQREAERLGKEMQEAALKISFGPGSPEEKTRQVMKLQEEFQARIKALYGT